jgi:signal transduction histidine kinase
METQTNPLSIGSIAPHRQEDAMQYVALLLHELRNPLAGIILSLEMLESAGFEINEKTSANIWV